MDVCCSETNAVFVRTCSDPLKRFCALLAYKYPTQRRSTVTHLAPILLIVLVNGAGWRRRSRLAGRRRRGRVGDVRSGHVEAELGAQLRLVDGGQLVA